MKVRLRAAAAAFALLALPAAAQPVTPRIPVTDTYHGVKVVDDYRWLENGVEPEGQGVERRAERARARVPRRPPGPAGAGRRDRAPRDVPVRLDQRTPSCAAERRSPCVSTRPAGSSRGSSCWPRSRATEGMRAVVDPNALDASGRTAFDWFVPSPDGARIAVSLSQGGSEEGTLHVFDVATGRETGDVIPLVQKGTAGGSAAWTADGTGLFYTRYPHAGERAEGGPRLLPAGLVPRARHAGRAGPLRVRQGAAAHRGDLPARERGRPAAPRARPERRQRRLLALRPEAPEGWKEIASFADGVVDARFGRDGSIWAISRKGASARPRPAAPGGRPRAGLGARRSRAAPGRPRGDRAGDARASTWPRRLEGRAASTRTTSRATSLEELPAPPVSAVSSLVPLEGDRVFYVESTSSSGRRAGSSTTRPRGRRRRPRSCGKSAARLLERRSRRGERALEGRHARPDVPRAEEGHEAGQAGTPSFSRATAASGFPRRRSSTSSRTSSSPAGSSSSPRSCAAAESSARTGTTPGGSRRSRTSSRTSSPARAGSSSSA